MSSNVDYTICPDCTAVNAAMWHPAGRKSYTVNCTVCGHEYEHGHYSFPAAMLRDLPMDGDDGSLALSGEDIRQLFSDEFGSGSEFDDDGEWEI